VNTLPTNGESGKGSVKEALEPPPPAHPPESTKELLRKQKEDKEEKEGGETKKKKEERKKVRKRNASSIRTWFINSVVHQSHQREFIQFVFFACVCASHLCIRIRQHIQKKETNQL